MKTIIRIFVAMAIAMATLLVLMAVGASTRVCLTVYFTVGLVSATLFGVFDIEEDSGKGAMHQTISDAARDMNEAA